MRKATLYERARNFPSRLSDNDLAILRALHDFLLFGYPEAARTARIAQIAGVNRNHVPLHLRRLQHLGLVRLSGEFKRGGNSTPPTVTWTAKGWEEAVRRWGLPDTRYGTPW